MNRGQINTGLNPEDGTNNGPSPGGQTIDGPSLGGQKKTDQNSEGQTITGQISEGQKDAGTSSGSQTKADQASGGEKHAGKPSGSDKTAGPSPRDQTNSVLMINAGDLVIEHSEKPENWNLIKDPRYLLLFIFILRLSCCLQLLHTYFLSNIWIKSVNKTLL